MQSKFWSSVLLFFVSSMLIASIWTFSGVSLEMRISDFISGLLILFFAVKRIVKPNGRADIYLFFIGLWLSFTPLLFWAKEGGTYLNETVSGFIVLFVALLANEETPKEIQSIPRGWSYNPSRLSERAPIAILSFLCWMTARAMASYQLGYLGELIDPVFKNGTVDVITSQLSKSFPVSDAGMGALAYTLEALMALHGGDERWHKKPIFVIFFCMLIIPVGLISTLLIISQPLIVGAWCFWCLLTALMMLLMISFAVDELVLVWQFLKKYRKEAPSLMTLLRKGSSCLKNPPEQESHFMPYLPLRGLTFPPTLIVSIFIGLLLMFFSSKLHLTYLISSLDHVLGALTVVVSMIAFAEPARSFRWCLIPIGAAVVIYGLMTSGGALYFHLLLGIALVLLSLRKGKIKEKFKLT